MLFLSERRRNVSEAWRRIGRGPQISGRRDVHGRKRHAKTKGSIFAGKGGEAMIDEQILEAFLRQTSANVAERETMLLRHRRELRELQERHEHGSNPYRVALGADYSRENVEALAALLREAVGHDRVRR